MNYYAILKKHYDGKIWGIAEDYTTLDWGDENETPKPTNEELITLWNNMEYDYLKEIMRKERNQLLKDCDHCALSDFPNRENYILYRQQLRELPENWTIDTPFPQKPT
jgi:hypothetical protein